MNQKNLSSNTQINWNQIPNSKIYFASDCGKIGSKYKRGARNKLFDNITEVKQSNGTNGYKIVHLYENGKRKTCMVHRLIARTFLGESDLFVNHKDLNKTNNSISNLEYLTAKENYNHAMKLGVMKKPPRNSHRLRKLSKEQIFKILSDSSVGCDRLGRIYNIQPSTIIKIRAGKSYKDWYDEYQSSI